MVKIFKMPKCYIRRKVNISKGLVSFLTQKELSKVFCWLKLKGRHNWSPTLCRRQIEKGVFKVKSGVKTWQVRGIWSQQLEHKQVPKRGTEPGVRKGRRSLLACHTPYKCSMETTHNSVKIKLGIKVMKWWKVWSIWKSLLVKGQNEI